MIGILHTVTPGDRILLHEIYRRLSYFPIVIGALLCGVRCGVILAAITSLAFIPHLQHFYHLGRDFYLGQISEIILYFGAGIVVGAVASRESRLREKYQDLSERLEKSYNRLHQESQLLLEVEEQLQVSQKLSALGELSASLAHEIKNPLGAIRGTAEIFLDEFPEGHPKREFVDILRTETTRLANTVDEVLRFSRNQQNPSPSYSPREPLSEVIERVISLLTSKFRTKKIDLHRVIPAWAQETMVEGDKMEQVLLNLLLNAFEAVNEKGLISLHVSRTEQEIMISISDNGPGVPIDEREKIFTPFYSSRENGNGLGLAISSRIIKSYNGRIDLHEAPEGGARFTVILPAQHASTPRPSP